MSPRCPQDITANDDLIFVTFLSRFQHTSHTSWKLQDALSLGVPARDAKKGAKCISTQAGSEEVTCVFVNKSKTNMIFQNSPWNALVGGNPICVQLMGNVKKRRIHNKSKHNKKYFHVESINVFHPLLPYINFEQDRSESCMMKTLCVIIIRSTDKRTTNQHANVCGLQCFRWGKFSTIFFSFSFSFFSLTIHLHC